MDSGFSFSNLVHPQHINLSDGKTRPMHSIHTIGQLISDPWYTIDELKRRHNANVPSHGGHHQGEDLMFAPNFDVRESANYYFLEGEFPGIANKSDIHIEWVGHQTLVIEAKVAPLDEEAEWAISHGVANDTSTKEEPKVTSENGDRSRHEKKGKELRTLLRGRHLGELHRSFSFPHGVQEETLKARLSSGLLKILVAKVGSEGEQRRRIEIED